MFEGHGEGMEEDHPQFEHNWRVTTPEKWDTIDSGNWILSDKRRRGPQDDG